MRSDGSFVVLACGDRDWTDADLIRRLADLGERYGKVVVIHGDCDGADKLAGAAARSLGMEVVAVPAPWGTARERAGPFRNCAMLDQQPDLVLAFHDDLWGRSKGTRHCVGEAQRRLVATEVCHH